MQQVHSKPLPFSKEAEQAILGSILLDGETIHVALTILDPSDFFSKIHRTIFKTMADLSRKDILIDALTVADALRSRGALDEVGGLDYLSELEGSIPTSQVITHHARIVKHKSALRRLIQIGDELTRQAWVGEGRPEDLIETIQSEVYQVALDLQNKNITKQVYGPKEIAKIAADAAGEWLENPEKSRGIQTGFNNLDETLNGLKDVNIVSASTGIGKTAFALNLAVNIAVVQRLPVLYLNHEMNLEEMTIRIQGILSGVPIRVIQSGKYSDQYPFAKVMKASTKLAECQLYLTDNQPKTINLVVGMIRKHKAQHDIKVVILDYLGEIEPSKEELSESEYLVYGRWVQRLKGVCTSLGIKLVLLAQLNREGDKEVSRSKIGGSWKIAQKADTFLILGVNGKGQHFLKIDKNRNGRAPVILNLDFNKENQRIIEVN